MSNGVPSNVPRPDHPDCKVRVLLRVLAHTAHTLARWGLTDDALAAYRAGLESGLADAALQAGTNDAPSGRRAERVSEGAPE